MKQQARVSEIDEITDAVEAVEEEFASLPDEALSRVSCLLICEELLVHLVQAGYRNIGVSTARGGVPFVDISARGEADSFEAPHVDDDYDRIGVEINQSILAAYDDYIDYRYRRGVNRYRVYLEPRKSADLGREIYEYYESADASAAERPLSLFRHVAGKHRAMAVFAVVNKSVKHLAALTLPVFAANINEILLESDVENDGDEILPKPVRGEIEFRDVVFGYDGQRPVLDGANIQVPAGSSVAFIGESGSGKSTLLGLALGLYSPQAGQVLVDGYDVDKLNKASYRKHIAVVPQSTALFSGTLWDNLVYGLNYITTSEVLAALESVGLAEMVREHPDGLHMTVYENGDNFSGGQRQRIAIARALLRQPDILLFDEATSALDAESERQVQEAIEAVMGECTMLIVAHRLNTIRKVDAVYRIANGRAVRCEPSEYQG